MSILCFLPTPFRAREWILTGVALGCALTALWFSNQAGLGAGGVLYLSVIVGTVLFVAIGGKQRAFFTALFTGTLSMGLVVWSVVDSIFVWHEPISRDQLLLPLLLLLFYVLIPTAFAWLVTLVIRWLEKTLRS